MAKYIFYKDDTTLIAADFIAQLIGRTVRINSLEVEFNSTQEATDFFHELVQKAEQTEQGSGATFVVRDRVLVFHGKVYELAGNEIHSESGNIYLSSSIKAKAVFTQLKQNWEEAINQGGNIICPPQSGGTTQSGQQIGFCECIMGQGDPTVDVNPPKTGIFYIDNTNWDIWVCIDNTPNKNKWKNIITGVVIEPLEPVLIKRNIQEATKVQVNLPTAATFVFYGHGWTAGNYHYFFRALSGNQWKNDAYYGNGFTVRQNCNFNYNYLDTPPSGDKDLVAIFAWDANGYEISFYEVNNGQLGNEVYHKTGNLKWCGNVDNVCIYDDDCNSGSSLGGIIYVVEIYDKKLPHDKFASAALKAIQDKQ